VEDVLENLKSKVTGIAADMSAVKDGVAKLVANTKAHNASQPRQDIPTPNPIFYGRQPFVDEVASLLAGEGTSRVCVTGVGGMGKTSVALAVTQTDTVRKIFRNEYIFWVPCIEAKSADLLRSILYAQLRVPAESYDSLEPLLAKLDTPNEHGLKERRLLLLDNFETPWLDGPDRAQVNEILTRLMKLPHIALLVTMTSGFSLEDPRWQARPLEALASDAARDAFKARYREAAGGHELSADSLMSF
jgi:hypothetical protein